MVKIENGPGIFPGSIFYIKKSSKFKNMINITDKLDGQLTNQFRIQLINQLYDNQPNVQLHWQINELWDQIYWKYKNPINNQLINLSHND